ncbi:MAG TPA: phosphodiester glycosidase family protein, partial [Candidatus Limiplasma sp.]|nr:phosphodiester glycosidase family protein [Candidatus Limiplasma sp.]
NPRTMAGVDARHRILLVTVDGHQPGQSLGLTLTEGAQLMLGLGAVSAMNLDGGGSTEMWFQGQILNKPSGGVERTVTDILCF